MNGNDEPRACAACKLVKDTVTDERVGLFTPDKDGYTHTSRGRVAVIAARRGTVVAKWVASSDFLNSRSAPSTLLYLNVNPES